MSAEPRSLDRLMIAALAALTLLVAASVVSIGFDIHRLAVISHLVSDASSANAAGFAGDVAAARASDHQTATIEIVEVVLLAISAVCFILWFHRAYRNLLRLGANSTRYRPGWAIGAWFVPILNLWRPKQIANDIWRGSDPRRPGEQPTWYERVSPLLWFWWGGGCLAASLAGLAHSRGTARPAHRQCAARPFWTLPVNARRSSQRA